MHPLRCDSGVGIMFSCHWFERQVLPLFLSISIRIWDIFNSSQHGMRTFKDSVRLRLVHISLSDIYSGIWARLSANWEPLHGGTAIHDDIDERQIWIFCYCTVELEFSRNIELEDCEENRMLYEDNQIMPSIFEQEILPRIRKLLRGPAIRMSLKTSPLTRQLDLKLLDPPPSALRPPPSLS